MKRTAGGKCNDFIITYLCEMLFKIQHSERCAQWCHYLTLSVQPHRLLLPQQITIIISGISLLMHLPVRKLAIVIPNLLKHYIAQDFVPKETPGQKRPVQ